MGVATSAIIVFAASRIWSLGEQILDELVPRNLISAVLKGDAAAVEKTFPKFYRLSQSEYELISRPEAYPGSQILKAPSTEESSDGSDHGDLSFGLGHPENIFTSFLPPGGKDLWEPVPSARRTLDSRVRDVQTSFHLSKAESSRALHDDRPNESHQGGEKDHTDLSAVLPDPELPEEPNRMLLGHRKHPHSRRMQRRI